MRGRRLIGVIVAGVALAATPVAAFANNGDWNWHHGRSCQTVRDSQLNLTERDNGESFCVRRGTQVNVLLRSNNWHGGQVNSQSFATVQDSGHALRAQVSSQMAIRGATIARYRAVQHGTDTLSSSRANCMPSHDRHHVSCHSQQAWSVSITVR
jgi:hypothetical protein